MSAKNLAIAIEAREESMFSLIDPDTKLEELATGFEFVEGPIWHPYQKHLIFSDIMGNKLYRWSETQGLSVFRNDSHMANGNTYDQQGRILTCEHATSRVSRTSS